MAKIWEPQHDNLQIRVIMKCDKMGMHCIVNVLYMYVYVLFNLQASR